MKPRLEVGSLWASRHAKLKLLVLDEWSFKRTQYLTHFVSIPCFLYPTMEVTDVEFLTMEHFLGSYDRIA